MDKEEKSLQIERFVSPVPESNFFTTAELLEIFSVVK